MSAQVEHARQQWEESFRRLEAARSDRRQYERLRRQVDVVTGELRRRVGQSFTLEELVAAYGAAESWSREAIEETAPEPGWPRTLALVTDAAFYLYARGASDYEP